MIGLKSGEVRLENYTDEWRRAYKRELSVLGKVIGNYIVEIQHVGSTAIPGCDSKPVIDIAAAVGSLDIGKKCIEPLLLIGYEYKKEAGIPGRHFFAKGTTDCRTHYLHIEQLNGELWRNHILFRDYLRQQSEEVMEYSNLKRKLEREFCNNRDAYARGKDRYIQDVLQRASNELELDSSGKSREKIQG